MQSIESLLTDSERLALSGILSAGHEECAESCEPLASLDAAPQYPPLSRAALSGMAPRAPRHYYGADNDEGETAPDLDNGDLDEAPAPRDVMPSRGMARREVARSLSMMGYTWGE